MFALRTPFAPQPGDCDGRCSANTSDVISLPPDCQALRSESRCWMATTAFAVCPRCGKAMDAGFAHKAAGLSFVAPEKLDHFIFIDEDLSQAGLHKFLPSKAEYFRSFLCRSCKLYVVDYSRSLSRPEAEQLAHAT